MKGDFSRDTFDVKKHFSRVLQQQGRVQLDADWNEQTAILLHYLRTLAADIIGPYAGPAENKGFQINLKPHNEDLEIAKGRYYVDGILCENEQDSLSYLQQADYPNPPALPTTGGYLVYLDVWERHISVIEDEYIREKALGGPDTASRTKVVWQVKFQEKPEDPQLDFPKKQNDILDLSNWQDWIKLWQPTHRGCLRAQVKQPEKATDPCLTAPDAKYRGPENQLYRVEIHDGGKVGDATFKWSRDNGAVVTNCRGKEGVNLTVDNSRGFVAGHWVELTNDGLELRGQPGTLVEVMKVEGDVLTLRSEPPFPKGLAEGESWPTKVRRWESGPIRIEEKSKSDNWLDLEHGIQIQFLKAGEGEKHNYRTGDYWLIPARVVTGNIEWPKDDKSNSLPQPPHGIYHHYAPLLSTIVSEDKTNHLRCTFTPINNCETTSHGEMGIGEQSQCESPSSTRS